MKIKHQNRKTKKPRTSPTQKNKQCNVKRQKYHTLWQKTAAVIVRHSSNNVKNKLDTHAASNITARTNQTPKPKQTNKQAHKHRHTSTRVFPASILRMTSLKMCSPTCESTADNGSTHAHAQAQERDAMIMSHQPSANVHATRKRETRKKQRETRTRHTRTVHEDDVASRIHRTSCIAKQKP